MRDDLPSKPKRKRLEDRGVKYYRGGKSPPLSDGKKEGRKVSNLSTIQAIIISSLYGDGGNEKRRRIEGEGKSP